MKGIPRHIVLYLLLLGPVQAPETGPVKVATRKNGPGNRRMPYHCPRMRARPPGQDDDTMPGLFKQYLMPDRVPVIENGLEAMEKRRTIFSPGAPRTARTPRRL